MWDALCKATGVAALAEDERFKNTGRRAKNADAVREAIESLRGNTPSTKR